MREARAGSWTAVIPVAPFETRLSRLVWREKEQHGVVRAIAADVMVAVAECPAVGEVVVVTTDSFAAASARSTGATVLADRPLLSPDPLNDAVRRGRDWALLHRADDPVVVVPADLPCATSGHLEAALHTAAAELREHDGVFVPDRHGVGATLVMARCPELLETRFGAGAARLHSAAGFHALVQVPSSIRHDVDDAPALHEAIRQRVGPRLGSALAG